MPMLYSLLLGYSISKLQKGNRVNRHIITELVADIIYTPQARQHLPRLRACILISEVIRIKKMSCAGGIKSSWWIIDIS